MTQTLCRVALMGLLALSPLALAEPDITVKGLLKNMVVLEVDGVMRTIKAGKTSPEGIRLISSDTKKAVVEINGQRQTLTLSRRIGGGTYKAPEAATVRIPRGAGGHYFARGKINDRGVSFLVDTGATSVVMNQNIAKTLGVDTSKGREISVQTANGVTKGILVTLRSVSVGTVTVNNVEAVVNQGAFPGEILLGNSYLARVGFKVDNGVLVLESRL